MSASEHQPTDVIYLSPEEERANTLTHALGCVLSLVAILPLVFHPANPELGLRITALLYSLAMGLVYFCSAMSHAVLDPRRRNRWRAWDQGSIYLLIAATYSPFIFACSPAAIRMPLMIAVWSCAVLGFYSKVLRRHRINGISTLSYILLGWFPAFLLFAQTPAPSLWWMVLGGACYMIGVGFLRYDSRYRHFHAIWHLWVLAGSASHFVAIYRLLAIVSAEPVA